MTETFAPVTFPSVILASIKLSASGGEIPLCPYDSCRLVAINLYSYVKNPFTPQAEFDFDLFRQHVGKAQRIMDDIIDLEMEKIETIIGKVEKDPETAEVKSTELNLWKKIRNKTLKGRRTGCGTTGEGDMLAALGYRYGTPEATAFSTEVHKQLTLAYYSSSVDMASERGAFEIYDSEREKNNPFINRIKDADPALYERMIKTGRRNIACLTIAPTGTTSIMTQTSSGIEPVFLPVYKRKRKVNPSDENVRIDFVDEMGDAFEEYIPISAPRPAYALSPSSLHRCLLPCNKEIFSQVPQFPRQSCCLFSLCR